MMSHGHRCCRYQNLCNWSNLYVGESSSLEDVLFLGSIRWSRAACSCPCTDLCFVQPFGKMGWESELVWFFHPLNTKSAQLKRGSPPHLPARSVCSFYTLTSCTKTFPSAVEGWEWVTGADRPRVVLLLEKWTSGGSRAAICCSVCLRFPNSKPSLHITFWSLSCNCLTSYHCAWLVDFFLSFFPQRDDNF